MSHPRLFEGFFSLRALLQKVSLSFVSHPQRLYAILLTDPGFFRGHAKVCSLHLLQCNIILIWLSFSSYLSSSFYLYFQLLLFLPPDSTPFFDFDTCLSAFPSILRWVCMRAACLHGLALTSLPALWTISLSQAHHWEIKVVNTFAAATWLWFVDPQLVEICRWFGWGTWFHRTVRQGWEKRFPVGVWGPGSFPLDPSLWGPVRPRYFPSLIEARDGLRVSHPASVFSWLRIWQIL